jgi:flagellar motor switch protein FliM
MDALKAVLAQKLGLSAPEPENAGAGGALSPMRQMRRALGRAADKAVGLSA